MAKSIDILINIRTARFNRGIKQTNQRLSSLGRTTGRVQRTMVAFAALFIARRMLSGMKDMITAAGDFQLQMIQIGRVSSIAGFELMGMRDALLELSTTMVASVDELAELAIVAGRSGINTREGMIEIAKSASMMANVADLTAVEATNAFIKISKAMKLPISEANKLASAILVTAKDFAVSESEIVKAMLRMVAAGKTLGLLVPEMIALAAVTVEVGLSARRAGTVWNRALFQMTKNIEKVADIMGVSAKEIKDAIDKDATEALIDLLKTIAAIPSAAERLIKVQEIFALVGARGAAPLLSELDRLREAMIKAGLAFDEGTELAKDYELVLGSFNKQAKLLGDTFKSLKIKVADEALPGLTRAVQDLTAVLKKLDEATLFLFKIKTIVEFFRDIGRGEIKLPIPEIRPGPQILPPLESGLMPPIEVISERINQIQAMFLRLGNISKETAEKIEKGFTQAFDKVSSSFGRAIAQIVVMGRSSGDVFKAMWQDMASFAVRMIAQIIAKMVILLAMIAAASIFFPGSQGAVATAGRKILFGFQKGGIVPGIGSGDRVPALLEPGELVIPKSQVPNVINNRFNPTVNISMAGAMILDDPNAVEQLYRDIIRPRIQQDIRIGRDIFF